MAFQQIRRCRLCGKTYAAIHPTDHYCSIDCRFWQKVDKSGGPESCWMWLANRQARSGHGVFRVGNRKSRGAHKFSWMLAHGAVPAGMIVRHKCDNAPCVNPDHLELGTPKQNTHDAMRLGWLPGATKHPPRQRNRPARNCLRCGQSFMPIGSASCHCSMSCRFWARVAINDPDSCWEWQGGKRHYGHGMFENKVSSRVAYELAVGPIPGKLIIRHKCDNPPCCNPAHLELGTMLDNCRDRDSRGRANTASGPRPHVWKEFCRSGHRLSETRVHVLGGTYCSECRRSKKDRQAT